MHLGSSVKPLSSLPHLQVDHSERRRLPITQQLIALCNGWPLYAFNEIIKWPKWPQP